jgi:two-component system alkaline phosphatase synthesis response regulator PhoP
MNNFSVLIIDDDPGIIQLLEGYLKQAGYRVRSASDGESGLDILKHSPPDLLLLDLMLPNMDGWEITRLIRADDELATIPIIMLTARVDDMDKILGLELGADDYVTKPFNPREVVARVNAMLRRLSRLDDAQTSHILQVGSITLDAKCHIVEINGEAVELTPTEFSLLQTLMQYPGQVFTRSELLEHGLRYDDYDRVERTVDSHIRNLRRKIEADPNNPAYIETVYGVGYRLISD